MTDNRQTDIEIARSVTPQPIAEVAAKLGIPPKHLHRYGDDKSKVAPAFLASQADKPAGRLILVTAISPTPAGEGKTTVTVGLGDGLRRIGRNAAVCIREPSLGPCFGMKGGAAGGGRSQVIPMEEINLHFTGDFHAVSAAHNLLAAMIDNHIYWGNALGIDTRRVAWRRVVDLNDRALRQITTSLGGVANGFPRESGFDITVASEVMAILCLARDLTDLEARLARMVVAERRDRSPVTCGDLKAAGAMTVLLKQALQPNLVQTLEHTPAFVHGGPFANIAHGCNSVVATATALRTADYVVTEAGFGADLGAEKFFDIKCRSAGLTPDAVVMVATCRALKMHGGVSRDRLGREDVPALRRGCANLGRHLDNIARFGVPAVVAINRFATDTDAEVDALLAYVAERGGQAHLCTSWDHGSAGIEDLAHAVAATADTGTARFAPLYPDDMPLLDKIETVATAIYGAGRVNVPARLTEKLAAWEAAGHGQLPVCIAKTQYSFSTDPALPGAPSGHTVDVSDVRLSAGAGFVVVLTGSIMTMPGLPRVPAAEGMDITPDGSIVGLS